jgi:hypothetical protein
MRWKRWPCPHCGHEGRKFAVACPECESLPWPAEARTDLGQAGRILSPGVDLEIRGRKPLYLRHRLSTPTGFLGLLTRRLFAGADWLGADGHDWRIDRIGLLGMAWILHQGPEAVAAAEVRGIWKEASHSGFQLWQENRIFVLSRTGLARRNFLLAVEDGPEVLTIHGGILNPLREVQVLSEVPLATVVLACFLACGLRQGERE